MALLRSGLILFVAVTGLAAFFVVAWYFWGFWNYGRYPSVPQMLLISMWVSAVTLPTVATLIVAARLGRKRPVLDGILLIGSISLLICYCLYLVWRQSDDPMTASWAGLAAQMHYVAGLAIGIPSYLASYYALRHSGLIAELAPMRKTKEPAEASP